MERVVCDYCGLPFRTLRKQDGKPDYCCSGCAMAARMNITADAFPVTPQLVYNLLIAFCVFNQALLLLLASALVNEERVDAAGRFALASAIVGLVVFAIEVVWQFRAASFRKTDAVVFVSAGAFAALDGYFLAQHALGAAAFSGVAATAVIALWQARGVARKRFARLIGKASKRENNESR